MKPVSRRSFLRATGAVGAGVALSADVADAVSETRRRAFSDADSGVKNAALEDDNLEAFFDEELERQLNEHNIAGATVSVVADGEVAFAKGYGYADVEAEEPVQADETLFRIGSVSKAVTGTAVMRGVENGDVDLETDVNEYLDGFQVTETYDDPVTLEHLGTHTAGFEEKVVGLFARDEESVASLGEAVRDAPARVRPPGELASYSNYGVGLEGHVLAEATGTEFAEYVRQQVFEPLGMERSTFRQPPPELEDSTSKGYMYTNEGFQEEGFEYVPLRPAGSMSATATDMARFMLVHLNDGTLDGTRFLEEETTQGMHEGRFTNHPAINSVGYGFYEIDRDGTRMVGHNGATIMFHSMMSLFPDENIGVFVSYNTATAGGVHASLMDAFVEEYVPTEEAETLEPDGVPTRADELEGWYRTTRISETTYEKFFGAPQMTQVRVEEDGTLVTAPLVPQAETKRWVEVEPLVFHEQDGHEHLAFGEEDGAITHFFRDANPVGGNEKLSRTEDPNVQSTVFGASSLVMLSGIAGWSGASLWRRGKRRFASYRDKKAEEATEEKDDEKDSSDRTTSDTEGDETDVTEENEQMRRRRLARWTVGVAGAGLLGTLIGFMLVLVTDPFSVVYGMPVWFPVVFALAAVGAVATVAAAGFCALAWRDGYWSLLHRIHYTLMVVAGFLLVWTLAYWNFLQTPF
ncbi:MAG: serine hydrolase [Halobacteriales archaeon]|nr:serine hydrolase [Halobacteriales archaeon]